MKVLILSCNTGAGHNSAATAVKDMMISLGHECVMKDALAYASQFFSKGVSSSYNSMVMYTPKAFGVSYRYWKKKKYIPGKVKSASYALNMMYSKKLYLEILRDGYDAVICTHVFAAQSVTHIKHRHGLKIPIYVIATDYSFCPYYDELDMDKYFISLECITSDYLERRIPSDKIAATGIPVSEKFNLDISKQDARKELGLDEDKFLCIIMSGSMGFGNVYDLIDKILLLPVKNYKVLVIAGKNEKLKKGIEEKYADNPDITSIGFTRKVHLYMKASDLVITKPGGLSSTEAMVCNVPMILTSPIPGVETENYDILTMLGVAIGGSANDIAAKAFEKVYSDDALCEQIRQNQKKYINGNAARDICTHVLKGMGVKL